MRALIHAAAATAFVVLATLNAGGYRYGASDQAFYIPAILEQLDPALFPRDTELIGPQARYFFVDEVVASLVARTGLPIEAWFAIGYVASLIVLYGALWRLGSYVFSTTAAVYALVIAETLRHRITRTGVNTLEGYFHPRVLVFAIGVWAVATFLRGHPWRALLLVAAGGLLHPTTAAFFVVLLLPAIWVEVPAARRPLMLAVTGGIVAVAWMLLSGPLQDGLRPMDARWRALLESKDYLFPAAEWNAGAWLANIGTAILAIGTLAYRVTRGHARPREDALLAGAILLLAGFLVTLPAVGAGWALLVQLQISRVFWLFDLLGTVALIWWLIDRPAAQPGRSARRATATLVLLAAAAVARGGWIAFVEHRDRPLVTATLPDEPWTRVIAWARQQPVRAHFLADPGHAWKHGAPLRYSGRDVLLEDVKDTAMAIYARPSANRVIERIAAIGDFTEMDEVRARELARRYRLDYLVIDRDLLLPEVHREGPFRIYDLR